jgi:hypothetical protein
MFPVMLDGVVPPLLVLFAAALLLTWRHWYLRTHQAHGARAVTAIVIALVVITAALEIGMGRAVTYRNGPVKLWVGNVNSEQNSQQLFDPYSFTHVVHGAVFYGLTRAVMGPASIKQWQLGG